MEGKLNATSGRRRRRRKGGRVRKKGMRISYEPKVGLIRKTVHIGHSGDR